MWRMSSKIFWLVINSGLIMFGHFSATFQFWRRLCFAGLCVCLSLFLSSASGSDSVKNFNFRSVFRSTVCRFFFVFFYFILLNFFNKVHNLCAHTTLFNSLVIVTFHSSSLMLPNMWHFHSPKWITHWGYIGEFPTGNFPVIPFNLMSSGKFMIFYQEL